MLTNTLPLLLTAAFLAGALNAVAGGGSFLTLPALLMAGLPPVAANATGTAALLSGYVAGTWGFREELRSVPRPMLVGLSLAGIAGGAIGAGLLLLTGNVLFRSLVPWLLLAGTGLFAIGPWLTARLRRPQPAGRSASMAGVLLVSVYGGYFNGGLGILLLAALGMLGVGGINTMIGLKNLLSTLLTVIAVAIYAMGGVVHWGDAALMMLAATAGGYTGARFARRMPAQWLRVGIVLIGSGMTVLMLVH